MENNESLLQENEALKKENNRLRSNEKSVRVTHEAVEDYQETQIRFRTIFETSRLGNKIIGRDLKILQVNPAMVSLLGYGKKQDIIGTHILDYAPTEFHSHWKTLQIKLWDLDTPAFSLETCLTKKDGSTIWCNVTSILFQDQGKTLGYSIIEDISQRDNLQKHKENFISIASHELKTPLTSLQATLQLMSRTVETETVVTDKLISLSKNCEKHILKLSKLVSDLLSSTKIDHGQLSLNITRFNFFELIDNCCKHLRLEGKYYITNKGHKYLEIDADEHKIAQVVVNLINNAVKYAPESMEIIIEGEESEEFVKISVSDKGKGIPADKLPFIFISYYQVQNDGNSESGMGLGLYISSEIIKKHGGEMGVTSVIGEGSTFWFTIPKNKLVSRN